MLDAPLSRAPVLFATAFQNGEIAAADLFDLAFLLRSPGYDVQGVCTEGDNVSGGERALAELAFALGREPLRIWRGANGFADALDRVTCPVNVIAVGGYEGVASALLADRARFRATIARLFLVGGFANDYAAYPTGGRLPIDPRLRERLPERFAATGDGRAPFESPQARAWARLLVSGEGVIWLPRDICLWRYFAPGLLAGGGATAEFLLKEAARKPDETAGEQGPVYLSALPALLLAQEPDPFTWMRLFRAVTARVEADFETGRITALTTRGDAPNLYAVVAIDGAALTKMLTARLRD